MKKRIIAWILLAGFVILLLNLFVFRFYWQLSMGVYVIILVAFVLTNGRLFEIQGSDVYKGPDGSDDDVVGSDNADNNGRRED